MGLIWGLVYLWYSSGYLIKRTFLVLIILLHLKSRLSLIVQVNVVLNRTVLVDSDWRFDNLCGSHLQSQSELYYVSWWYYTLVIDLIGQLRHDVIGRLSVRPWCYWLWRLAISNLLVNCQFSSRSLVVSFAWSRQ